MLFTNISENPQNTPDLMKANLAASIAKVVHENYPTDKYRSRKLDFETLTQLLITMDGGSIAKELLAAGLDVSASAFVQRRNRFEWRQFEKILEEFNELCADSATFKGFRVFAVDGTSVNLARDPKADMFMFNDSTPKGYNQVHVTPLYDVLNKTTLTVVFSHSHSRTKSVRFRVCFCLISAYHVRPSSSATAGLNRTTRLRT